MKKNYITTIMLIILSVSFINAQTAYITNGSSNSVSVINVATHTVTSTITVGANPVGVSVSADGTKVYVGNQNDSSVSVISTATHSVVATIHVGKFPYGIIVSSDGSKVYVANISSSTISVINTASNTVSATITVATPPQGLSLSPDGANLYVTNPNNGSVSVINTTTNTVSATIPVGSGPLGICVSPNGTKLYVANSSDNTLSVINTSTNTVTDTIHVGSYPGGVTVTPDGSKVYVSNIIGQAINVINTTTNTVTATIPVGFETFGVSVSPDGSKLYVANGSNNNASVINTTNNTILNTIVVGNNPQGFGNFISTYPTTYSITTGSVASPLCANSQPSVPYTISGTFNAGNVFTAELSDASGSFNSPVNIGTLSSTLSGSISATIPSNTVGGTGYRIRVVSSNPPEAGAVNGSNITIHPIYNQNVSAAICTSSIYTFPDGATSTTATVHTSLLSTVNSCDSTIVTTLTVNPTYSSNASASICDGNMYTFPDGTTSTTATVHTSHLNTVNSCDSSIVTTLTINPTYSSNVSASICDGNMYTFPDGTTSTTATVHTSHLSTINSCDSSIVTTLTINPTYSSNVSASICDGNMYTFPDGTTSTTATVHTSLLSSASTCDSSIVTTLTINPTYSSNVSASICLGSTYTFPDGTTSTTATVHTSNLSTVNSCDSSIVTTLTINPTYSSNVSASICDGNTYTFPDGTTSTTGTVHTSLLSSASTCDSIIVTTLTVNSLPTVTINLSAFDTVCQSIVVVNLTGESPIGGIYSGTGVIGNTFNTDTAGLGSQTITYTYMDGNTCSSSATGSIYVDVCTGIDETVNNNSFTVFPNPTNGQFTISLLTDNATIIVTDILGQQILKTQTTQKTVNLQLDNNGVYIVYAKTKQGTTTRKLIVNR